MKTKSVALFTILMLVRMWIDSFIDLGQLFKTVHPDESVWTIEDGNVLDIILSKAEYQAKDTIWESLMKDGRFRPDYYTLQEMNKKLDLEKFQMENPGMNFSRAKLSKSYDFTPEVP